MNDIPIHKLNDRAAIGLEIRHTNNVDLKSLSEIKGVHRDDHYIFFMLEKGNGIMMIDFSEVIIREKSIYYVLPGQVHHRIDNTNAEGWFMAVDTLLVPKEFRLVFENQLLLQQPYELNNSQFTQCNNLIKILNHHYINNTATAFYMDILYSLLNSFVGMAACGYSIQNESNQKQTRSTQIAYDFKNILTDNFKIEKRPSVYANMLNISESYLNEALKKVTGFSVSYWINHEVVLEAKRLLYYSQLNVKQIAHRLGYEDHTYFSRLFKKTVGLTPLSFRDSSR